MRATLLLFAIAVGCSKPAPANPSGVDCDAYMDKVRPIYEARNGGPLTPDRQATLLKFCQLEPDFKSDPEYKCVTEADDEAAVLACAPSAKPTAPAATH